MSLNNLPRTAVCAGMLKSKPEKFSGLMLPAFPPGRDGESPVHKEVTSYSHRPLTPRQAAGNAPAPGFTLIELVIVIAIVGVLGAIAIPLYAEYIEKAKIVRAVSEITTISRSITAYNLDNGKYPQSLNEVSDGAFPDPWGAPYRYLNIQTATGKGDMRKDKFLVPINTDYDLYSMGKDGKSSPPLNSKAGRDDIVRANDGGYIGLASDF